MDKNVVDHVFLGKGRMNRTQFAGVLFLLWIIEYILFILARVQFAATSNVTPYFSTILIVFSVLILTGILIRRGHDLGIPTFIGAFTGIMSLMSIVGQIFLGALPESLTIYVLFSSIILVLYGALYSLILLILSGKKETNKYGEQPKNLKKMSEIIRFWWTGKS